MSKGKKAVAIIACVAVLAAAGLGIYNAVTTVDFGEITVEGVPQRKDGTTRVLSYNLRCANDPEGSVKNRSQLVVEVLKAYAPDTFGVQEATGKWISILDRELGDKYERVGEPRDKLGYFSEYSAVYFLKDKYKLLDSGTFWLSETPEVKYSSSFDSACVRIASWAMLEDKESGVKYTHINTHLDHVLESTRVGQIGVLTQKLKEFQKEGTVVVTGDFNTYRDGDVYAQMLEITDDTQKIAKSSEDGITYHNYGKVKDEGQGPIDFIFVTKGTKAENYNIIDNTFSNMYPSDHYAISSDIYLK